MRVATVFLFVVALCSSALAEPGALIVAGKSRPRDQETATRAIGDVLRTAGWTLPDKPFSKADSASIVHCFREPAATECVLRVARGVKRVAFISIDPDPNTATGLQITARLVIANVASVMTATEYCDHCTDDSVASSAVAATKSVLDRLSVEGGRTVLAVHSEPQGARFSVDGALVGATDTSVDVTPGPHLVLLELDGYESASRNVEATDGKTANVSVTLRKLDGHDVSTTAPNTHSAVSSNASTTTTPATQQPTEHHSIALPIALVTIGGAAVIGGAVLLVMNDPSTTAVYGQEQRQFYRDTLLPGALMLGGGAVIGAVGGYLWWKYTSSSSSPGVSLLPERGAVMSWSGSF